MTILYKLVGVTNTRNTCTELSHKDWDDSNMNFTLADTIAFYGSLGLDEEKCKEVKFITNAEVMSAEKKYDLSKGNLTVYVFSQVEEIKKIIFKIFQENGKVSSSVNHSKSDKSKTIVDPTIAKPLAEEMIKITPEIIEESNKMTVELFKNKNFKTLMKIYYEDPTIYKTFASYVVSGDMIEDPFSESSEDNFDDELEQIVSMGVPVSEDIIRTNLKKFNGHINLTLRFLLTKECSN